MSRPRFLADNDLNDAIVVGVLRREPAAEFARLRDLGLATRSDAEVLDFAARENWIVVSHDVNTMREAASTRLAAGLPMNGLLLAHQRTPVICHHRESATHLGRERSRGVGRPDRFSAALTHAATTGLIDREGSSSRVPGACLDWDCVK